MFAAEWQRQIESFPKAEFKDGAWRWRSNGHIPFEDMLTALAGKGFITAEEAVDSIVARQAETKAFLAEYRASQKTAPTTEEQFGMLAAHGPGVTVTDVVTGRTWTT